MKKTITHTKQTGSPEGHLGDKRQVKVLVVGANSYIAQNFIKAYRDQFSITTIARNPALSCYFDISPEVFYGIDVVVNCVGIAHQKSPNKELSEKINTKLPIFLALQAKKYGVKQFVQLSTISVYGSKVTAIDGTTPIDPDTVYGKTKAEADFALQRLSSQAFSVTIVRPPIIYGKGAPGNMHKLINLIKKVPLLPFAFTKNSRSILYIENCTRALSRLIKKNADGVFLLRDKEMPSLGKLCATIAKKANAKTYLFSPPQLILAWLLRIRFPAIQKLFGDLTIDDRLTQKVIGEYATVPPEEALGQTLGQKRAPAT